MSKTPSEKDTVSVVRWDQIKQSESALSDILGLKLDSLLEYEPDYLNGVPVTQDLAEFTDRLYCCGDGSIYLYPEDLVEYASAYTKGKMIGRRMLRMPTKSYFYLSTNSELPSGLARLDIWDSTKISLNEVEIGSPSHKWSFSIDRGMTCFAFGLLKIGGLDDNYLPCFYDSDFILCVEHESQVSDQMVEALAKRYLFEVVARTGLNLSIAEYPEYDDSWEYEDDCECEEDGEANGDVSESQAESPLAEAFERREFAPTSIVDGNGADELPEMWLQARQMFDPTSGIIAFARVLEYVSVTVSRLAAHSRLRMILRSEHVGTLPSSFLDLVLDECRTLNGVQQSDADMLRLTIKTCCIPRLLAFRVRPYSPNLANKLQNGSKDEQDSGITEFANSVVATRNALVHAKSNYDPTGAEVSDELLGVFVKALEHASLMSIRWFFEQPSHARLCNRSRKRKK